MKKPSLRLPSPLRGGVPSSHWAFRFLSFFLYSVKSSLSSKKQETTRVRCVCLSSQPAAREQRERDICSRSSSRPSPLRARNARSMSSSQPACWSALPRAAPASQRCGRSRPPTFLAGWRTGLSFGPGSQCPSRLPSLLAWRLRVEPPHSTGPGGEIRSGRACGGSARRRWTQQSGCDASGERRGSGQKRSDAEPGSASTHGRRGS